MVKYVDMFLKKVLFVNSNVNEVKMKTLPVGKKLVFLYLCNCQNIYEYYSYIKIFKYKVEKFILEEAYQHIIMTM